RRAAHDDGVAVLLARLRLGEPRTGDLRVGVDRTRHRRLADSRLVPHRVLRGDLALAESRVRELPVAGDVAGRVDVRHAGAAMFVVADPLAVEADTRRLEPDALDERRTPDGDEHEVAVDRLPLAEVNGEVAAVVVDLRALLGEVLCDTALAKRLLELLPRVLVLRRDEVGQHLDDRHLGAEAIEDRRELAADDPAAEDDEARRDLRLGQQPRRVYAARGVEPGDRRPDRERAGGDDRALEVHVLRALDRDRVRAGERPLAVDPLDVVRLEQRGDAAGHLIDDGVLPRGDRVEVERRVGGPDAELCECLARVVVGVRALHPRLGRDAPDAQARAAELRLGLDAGDLAAELRGADRRRVAGRAASENCDVDIHGGNPRRLAAARAAPAS